MFKTVLSSLVTLEILRILKKYKIRILLNHNNNIKHVLVYAELLCQSYLEGRF